MLFVFFSSITSLSWKKQGSTKKKPAFLDQLVQLGRVEQALRCTAPPPGAWLDIPLSCVSPQHSTAFAFVPLTPASLPCPSSLLILGALSFPLIASFVSLLAVIRQENTDLCILYLCFSFFPVPLWLLISPGRWVSLSCLLPFFLTFPLLLVRHSLLSCCETFMLFHTVKWSLSRSLLTISLTLSSI